MGAKEDSPRAFELFKTECQALVLWLAAKKVALSEPYQDKHSIAELGRELKVRFHKLKGAAGFFELYDLTQAAANFEQQLKGLFETETDSRQLTLKLKTLLDSDLIEIEGLIKQVY